MEAAPYHLSLPERRTTSAIFSSAHSGRNYPSGFVSRSRLDEHEIRLSEDAYVDRLFASVPGFGAPLLCADIARAYVDLNRSPKELDPELIEGLKMSMGTPRTRVGLGVIPRIVTSDRDIYSGKLRREEAEIRIKDFFHPYHEALQGIMDESIESFGQAVLFDCHSMPHDSISPESFVGNVGPDVILGDRHGRACGSEIIERVEAAFAEAGFTVARNVQFSGAYTVQRHGRPELQRHAVQIEINRSLYLDERSVTPNRRFDEVRRVLKGVIVHLADIGRNRFPIAAE